MAKAAAAAQAGDTVYLRGGAYRETLVPIRSGTPGAPIVFSGYPGEQAVLCGTDFLTGTWSAYQGNIYQFTGAAPTTALFVDGAMMQEARWPNAPINNYFSGFATAGTGTTPAQVVDPNLPAQNLNGARVHIISGMAWVSYTRAVTNYGGGSFGFDKPLGGMYYQATPGNLYFLYGSLALLDTAGEWYQDPSTGKIYLWAPGNTNPSTRLVEIAARKRVVNDNGQSYIQVRNLFTFGGGIFFTNANGCVVDNVHQKYVQHYTEVDSYGAEGDQNGFSGGNACTWIHGSILYSAGNGLYISGTGHYVADMNISEVAYIATYRGNIQTEGSGHTIEFNTLFDSGRYGVWHDQTTGGVIRHNEIYNSGLVTSDVGATYAYNANGLGLEISYNWIHDIHASVGDGIYLDSNTSNFLVHHNLVENCQHFGIQVNFPSLDNQVYNNTIVNCAAWIGGVGNSGFGYSMAGTSIINNLGVGTGKFDYSSPTVAPVTLNNGTYPPVAFVPGGYHLAAGSGAIDQGRVIPGITNGYWGAAPDVGAFEYGPAPWSAGATVMVPVFPYPNGQVVNTVTPTSTGTSTLTPVPTVTFSRTATKTSTFTQTTTRTFTGTMTFTTTLTSTATYSMTPTVTRTGTLSSTQTHTPVPPTATLTKTFTPSSTDTATATRTFTSTATSTFSFTPIPLTATPTSTAAATHTPTVVIPSSTPTGTPTFTPTITQPLTATPSSTPTGTNTKTATASSTFTLTDSPTATSTVTFSFTATSTWGSTLTGTFTFTNSSTPSMTLTRSSTPTLTATPSNTSTLSQTLTPSATLTGTSSFTQVLTKTFTTTPSNTPTPTSTSTNTRTSTNTDTPILPTLTPTHTNTVTNSLTPTVTVTWIYTSTATRTFTPTNSFTATSTDTFTPLSTSTGTPTSSATPKIAGTPVIYPNPWDGDSGKPLKLRMNLTVGGEVKVKLFTTAFRKIWQGDFPIEPAGSDDLVLDIPSIANGIYYLAVEAQGKRWIVKLMVIQ